MIDGFGLLRRGTAALLVMGVLPLLGCGGNGEEMPPAGGAGVESNPLSQEAQQLVTQGNLAQRNGEYADALDAFTQALELYPDHPVPQFGCLMAAEALGDTLLAQSLRKKLETTGPELLQMLTPGGGMGGMSPSAPGGVHAPAGTLPPGHPITESSSDANLESRIQENR